MNNPDLGQVFTSSVIADYMVSLFTLNKEASILDPCFGGGAFLKALRKASFKTVTGYEIDKQWYDIATADYEEYAIVLGDFLRADSAVKYNGIIMNPPYIRHEKIDDLADSGITKEFLFSNPLFEGLPRTANLYMFFIVKAIDLLNDNGEIIAIFPSSWMSARGGKSFKKIIEERACITDQIDVYGEVFEGNALVEVSILKMVKTDIKKTPNIIKTKVLNGELIPDNRKEADELIDLPVPFGEYGTVRRGLTTGCNTIFINPPLATSEHVKPIISSPKDFAGYNTDNARLDYLLYVENLENLNQETKDYLISCEEKIIATREPKTFYEKIANHQCWYKLNLFPCDGIVFSYFVRNEMRFALNTSNATIRDNFYVIHPREGVNKYLLVALLNNYYTFLQLEKAGKKYGAGLLKIQRYDIEALHFIDISKLSENEIELMCKLGERLVNTNEARIIEEITRVIAEHLNYPYEKIKLSYETEKNNRLERV